MIDDGRPPSTPEELAQLCTRLEAWLTTQEAENPAVAGIERDGDERRWVVRLLGEEKAHFAVWFFLGQRSLSYETYLLPAPEEQHALFYEHLLRRNFKLRGATFAIGPEDAIYLVGSIPNGEVDDVALDRILGTLYAATEDYFRPALRIGFASRFP
ncbi:MAG: YbjN domain-containing protein [Acidimicrobiia bacterium]